MPRIGTNKHYPCGHDRTPKNMGRAGIGECLPLEDSVTAPPIYLEDA
jgi:hypothetical protein